MHIRLWLGLVGSVFAACATAGCGDESFFAGAGGAASSSATTGGSTSTTGPGGGGEGGAGGTTRLGCTSAADCQLVNTCCDCMGLPSAQDPPSCAEQCIQDKCSELGLHEVKATCAVGRCVLGVSCNPAAVTCEVVPPSCPPGYAAAVVGDCWGGCIPTTECADVASCEACNGPNDTCVAEDTQVGRIYHCVEAAADCTDCACLGPSVCLEPFDTCTDVAPGAIACSCPTCLF